MSGIDVLVGNNLPLYREVLVSAFRAMRPDLAVESVSDVDLDAEILRLRPSLVICSSASQTIRDLCPAWILLFPGERDEAIVTVAGKESVLPHAGISELLAVIGNVRPARGIHPNG
jgi:hypothetical protein